MIWIIIEPVNNSSFISIVLPFSGTIIFSVQNVKNIVLKDLLQRNVKKWEKKLFKTDICNPYTSALCIKNRRQLIFSKIYFLKEGEFLKPRYEKVIFVFAVNLKMPYLPLPEFPKRKVLWVYFWSRRNL